MARLCVKVIWSVASRTIWQCVPRAPFSRLPEPRSGATISVTKRIPAGSGLGGGSSDAATTLIALNRLWDLNLPRSELSAIGLHLGADVPFFLHGQDAFAEGIGERLTTIALPPIWFAIVWPRMHVSTREIFGDAGLTRNSKATKIADFSAVAAKLVNEATGNFDLPSSLVNDLEPVARRRYPVIDEAIKRLDVLALRG